MQLLQVRVAIFGMQAGDNFAYGGIGNQPSSTYSSQYIFLVAFFFLLYIFICHRFYRKHSSLSVIIWYTDC